MFETNKSIYIKKASNTVNKGKGKHWTPIQVNVYSLLTFYIVTHGLEPSFDLCLVEQQMQ